MNDVTFVLFVWMYLIGVLTTIGLFKAVIEAKSGNRRKNLDGVMVAMAFLWPFAMTAMIATGVWQGVRDAWRHQSK